MGNILLYRDEGTSAHCLQALSAALQAEQFGPIQWVDRTDLARAAWKQEATLLIIPGGRDVPYQEALRGAANGQIRSFVEEGGTYLGICAGGYYGSARIEFEKGNAGEIVAERELQFFPGLAQGPVYAQERVVSLSLSKTRFSHPAAPSYYKGGCSFLDAEAYPGVEVLARYSDLPGAPAAIIRCRFGRGQALLSGVHPEFTGHSPSLQDPLLQEALKAREPERFALFRTLINIS